jgi:hypothetical protein
MILETKMGRMQKSLETIYDEFIDGYLQGNFTEGVCHWNGDDALMSPYTFGKRFGDYCKSLGYDETEYDSYKNELMEWCEDHLLHLESKFR